jgi:hypothetical protein
MSQTGDNVKLTCSEMNQPPLEIFETQSEVCMKESPRFVLIILNIIYNI